MRSFVSLRFLVAAAFALGIITALSIAVGSGPAHLEHSTVRAASTGCPSDDSGLKLPPGFCATIFADGIGHSRHLAVSDKGVVYVNTWSGEYFPAGEKVHEGGFLVALQDSTGSGHADIIRRFGPTAEDGSHGGTGIYLYDNHLYAEM